MSLNHSPANLRKTSDTQSDSRSNPLDQVDGPLPVAPFGEPSHIQHLLLRKLRVLRNKREPRLRLGPHQPLD
jgi:hypothetical protein